MDITRQLNDLLGPDFMSSMTGVLRQLGWAEEEIGKAKKLRPKDAALLDRAFLLLCPRFDRMQTEFVYRSHCRELLRRVGRGEDTRPGTYAEIACACGEQSLMAPLTPTGFGTYARAWNEAHFPAAFLDEAAHLKHVEFLYHAQIDEMIWDMKRKLAVPDRVIPKASLCRSLASPPSTSGCLRHWRLSGWRKTSARPRTTPGYGWDHRER